MPEAPRPSLMTGAAVMIILLAACAAALPLLHLPSGGAVGWLLLAAGVTELVAGAARHAEGRLPPMVAGAATTIAGLLFIVDPLIGLFPVSYVVTGWLFVRGAILLASRFHAGTRLKIWALFAGLADLTLALMLAFGLPIIGLVSGLFGATPEMLTAFAIMLAVSFLITGLSLLALAAFERERSTSTAIA